jgi:hypothetical protein
MTTAKQDPPEPRRGGLLGKLFQPDLSRAEAAKRTELLKREIELANSV